MDWQQDETDPSEYMRTLRTDLFDDEVYVFTPKGEVKTLPAGATPIDFAYAVHTDVGHRTVGAKVNGRIVPLHYRLKNGDFVEILTSKSGRGPSRDWMTLAASSRARNKIRQWFTRESRGELEQKGRDALDQALKAQNLPYRKLQGSSVLAQVIRETGFKKAEDFYIALGSGKLGTGQIVNKVLQRLKTEEVAEEPAVTLKPAKARSTVAGDSLGIIVPGVDDVLVRLAKCCTPVPGRPDRRLHLARARDHDPPRRLPERAGADAEPGAVHAGRVGRRRLDELPRPDRRRGVGPAAPARGRRADVRRARRQHRLLRRHRRGRDGAELVHGRGRRREGAAVAALGAPQPRSRVRRVPRHAGLADDRVAGWPCSRSASTAAAARPTPAVPSRRAVHAAAQPSVNTPLTDS